MLQKTYFVGFPYYLLSFELEGLSSVWRLKRGIRVGKFGTSSKVEHKGTRIAQIPLVRIAN